jgi:hypothetical protein
VLVLGQLNSYPPEDRIIFSPSSFETEIPISSHSITWSHISPTPHSLYYYSLMARRPTSSLEHQIKRRRSRPISAADGRGYVYILDEGATLSGNRILKIGMTKNFIRRFSQHQRMCPKRNREVVRKKKVRFRRREGEYSLHSISSNVYGFYKRLCFTFVWRSCARIDLERSARRVRAFFLFLSLVHLSSGGRKHVEIFIVRPSQISKVIGLLRVIQ